MSNTFFLGRKLQALALVLALAITLPALGPVSQLSATPPSNTPFQITFRDDFADKIRSDGAGVYVDNVAQVAARIVSTAPNMLSLLTNNSKKAPIRKLYLDFSSQAACPDGCTPPFVSALVDANWTTNIQNGDGQFAGDYLALPVGESSTGFVKLEFTDPGSGQKWEVRYNSAQYPGTTPVTITRTAADTWEIEASSAHIARLVKWVKVNNQLVPVPHGDYFMPYHHTAVIKP